MRLLRIVLASALVGLLTGLTYVALAMLMNLTSLLHNSLYSLSPVFTVFLAALGGLVTGLILRYVSTEVAGPGIDAAIYSIVVRNGFMEARTTASKFVATILTVGFGASGGLVGPMAQIGTGLGSIVSRALKLEPDERRKIALTGLGAGIASILQTPVSSALACMEILYRGPGIEGGVLIPSLIASFTSSLLVYAFTGYWFSHLSIQASLSLVSSPRMILASIAIGVVAGLLAKAIAKLYFSLERAFSQMPIPMELKPSLGCALAALIALAYPSVYGTGWNLFWLSLSPHPLQLTITLMTMKIFATIFTLSSGGSGGIFAPTIAVGALLGSSMMHIVGLNSYTPLLSILGVASMLSALCRVPLAAIVLVIELCGGVPALVPAVLTSLIAYLVAGPRATIYKSQLEPPSQ